MQFIREKFIWLVAIPVLIGALALMKYYWPEYPDDNVVEVQVENLIKYETGITVDLTPASKEPDDRCTKEPANGESKGS